MKHITIIPDCPKCGKELRGVYKNLPPFTNKKPWGSGVEGWWECTNCDCDYESEHFDHKPYADVKEIVESNDSKRG